MFNLMRLLRGISLSQLGNMLMSWFSFFVQGQNAQTVAYQREELGKDIHLLFQRDSTLYGRIQKGKNLTEISSRAMRIPADLLAGGIFSQVNPDGGDFGRGSALTSDFFQVTSVYFAHATEWSKLAEKATDSDKKAVAPAAKRNLEAATKQIRTNIEALLNTDGSGTLDTIVAVSGNTITVNNANQFYDNQPLQIVPSLGAASLGNVQVLSVDTNSKQIILNNAPPGGTAAGMLLVIAGAPGVAASSLFGVRTFQVDSNTGTYLQLARSAYPGKLKTPHIAMNNQAITPQAVRAGEMIYRRALGVDSTDLQGAIAHLGVDQLLAWENVGLVVSQVIQNQMGGDRSENMLKEKPPGDLGPFPILLSNHAKPGVIDVLGLKNWGRAETQPIEDLDYGGQTFFPVYGASGGVSGATINYIWTGFQVYNANPRAGIFWDGCAIPNSL